MPHSDVKEGKERKEEEEYIEPKRNKGDMEVEDGGKGVCDVKENTKLLEYPGMEEEEKEHKVQEGHATWEELLEGEEKVPEGCGRSKESLMWIKIMVGREREVKAIIDYGATHSCMDGKFYEELKELGCVEGELPVINIKLTLAAGKRKIIVYKQVMIEMNWLGKQYHLVKLIVADLFYPLVLGLDWLKSNGIVIDCERNLVYGRDTNGLNEEMRKTLDKEETKVMAVKVDQDKNLRCIKKIIENQRKDQKWGIGMMNIEEKELLGIMTNFKEKDQAGTSYQEKEDIEKGE